MTEKVSNYRLNISTRNTSNAPQRVVVRRNLPDYLRNNLTSKQMKIFKFYINNTYLPKFIPDRPTDNILLTNPSAVSNVIFPATSNVDTINSTNYFIIIRLTDNSLASISYIQHIPQNLSPTPSFIITDSQAYYQNPYYYYSSINSWLVVVQNAINATLVNMGYTGNAILTMTPTDSKFHLMMDTTTLGAVRIEFSDALANILPFTLANPTASDPSIVAKSKIISFSTIKYTNAPYVYHESIGESYDTMFPFTELLIKSDDLVAEPTQFMGDTEFANQGERYDNVLLAFDIRTDEPQNIYNYYKYITSFDTDDLVDFKQDSNASHFMTFKVALRLRDNSVIDYYLNPNEQFSFTLITKVY